MFQFPGFPAYDYFIHRTLRDSSSRGFPHSDICGSTLICSSPQLFAACHVLLRLPMPRHSPCALFRLNSFVYALSDIYFVLSLLELLCFHIYSYLSFFASGKIVFYPPERPDFLKISSFPFAFYFVCSCAVISSPLFIRDSITPLPSIRFSMSSRLPLTGF